MALNLSTPNDSPTSTRFMISSPPPEKDGRQCWPNNLHQEYKYYLKRLGNRSVLTREKRKHHRFWLINPKAKLRGETSKDY
jgi:hypothetical protein